MRGRQLPASHGGLEPVLTLPPLPPGAAHPRTCRAAGEVLLRIPTRLAITDQVDEEDDSPQAAAAREQPWSARLAGRLLDLAAQGGACPWAPYLAVLPARVPAPLAAFSWEDVQAVEVGWRAGRGALL